MKAYTYLVKHIPSGKVYYGSRKSDNPVGDLFIKYFTSSRDVAYLIRRDGVSAFIVEIRRLFLDYTSARKWENKVLRRMHVVANEKFLNRAVSAPSVCLKESEVEKERRRKISEAMKLRWTNKKYRESWENPSQERRIKLSMAGRASAGVKKKRLKSAVSIIALINFIVLF